MRLQLHIFSEVKESPHLSWLPPSLPIIQKMWFNLFPSNSSTANLDLFSDYFLGGEGGAYKLGAGVTMAT